MYQKKPMAFQAVICLPSKDFRTRLMYQNRVLDLFENYDYLRTTNLKNHLDTQQGFGVVFNTRAALEDTHLLIFSSQCWVW
jgi:hypothetical protein